jgi:hypothetical protein
MGAPTLLAAVLSGVGFLHGFYHVSKGVTVVAAFKALPLLYPSLSKFAYYQVIN